jgi:hypothetical protein
MGKPDEDAADVPEKSVTTVDQAPVPADAPEPAVVPAPKPVFIEEASAERTGQEVFRVLPAYEALPDNMKRQALSALHVWIAHEHQKLEASAMREATPQPQP